MNLVKEAAEKRKNNSHSRSVAAHALAGAGLGAYVGSKYSRPLAEIAASRRANQAVDKINTYMKNTGGGVTPEQSEQVIDKIREHAHSWALRKRLAATAAGAGLGAVALGAAAHRAGKRKSRESKRKFSEYPAYESPGEHKYASLAKIAVTIDMERGPGGVYREVLYHRTGDPVDQVSKARAARAKPAVPDQASTNRVPWSRKKKFGVAAAGAAATAAGLYGLKKYRDSKKQKQESLAKAASTA